MTNQFRVAGLYPTLLAPEFSQHGGVVASGTTISISTAQGNIYVTFDGTDPREAFTGAIAANALAYATPFAVTNKVVAKARALHSGQWSALTEAAFRLPPPNYAALRVAELMYAPIGGDDYAWIDLVNTSTEPLDLSGISFIPTGEEEPAVEWTAPEGLVLPGGGHVVLARNPVTFATRNIVPPGTPVLQYRKNLARSGEPVTFGTPTGEPFFSFTYTRYWYPETHNTGRSLVAVDFLADEPLWSTAANWRPSTVIDGTPAASETPRVKAFTLQDGVLSFPSDGIEWGFKVMWSTDLDTWHECPTTTVTHIGGIIQFPLPDSVPNPDRCFFKIINP